MVVSAFSAGRQLRAQGENVPRVHPFTSRIQVHVRGQGFITCNRDWWEGVWGEVLCHKKVQQSFLNQTLDPPPHPPNKKFLDLPLLSENYLCDLSLLRHITPRNDFDDPFFCSHFELLGSLRVITKIIQLNVTATSLQRPLFSSRQTKHPYIDYNGDLLTTATYFCP